jgi:O-methyltransferase domain
LPAADAYVLMEVLHDWSDADAARILAAGRRAAAPGSRLLRVEVLVPDMPGPDDSELLDVVMLAVTGGPERTNTQYGQLLADAGFRLEGVVPTGSTISSLTLLLSDQRRARRAASATSTVGCHRPSSAGWNRTCRRRSPDPRRLTIW